MKWLAANRLYIIGGFVGAIAGLLYWKYVGCLTGSCSITSNSWRSTIYGAAMVALVFGLFKKSSSKQVSND